MLCLENRRPAEGVDIIIESNLVVVFLHGFHSDATVLREGQVVGAFLEIVFRVALSAHQRPHLLVRSFLYIHASALPCLIEGRASWS